MSTDQNHDPLLYVDIAGRKYGVQRPWGTLPAGIALRNPSNISTDSAGNVYLYQRANPPVLVFDSEGHFLRFWGDGQLVDAHGIHITPDDHVWLVDRDAHQILRFDTHGNLLSTIGDRHQPRFQAPFNHPTGIAMAPDGEIYVTDGYANARVHRFAPDGTLIDSWGEPGRELGQFRTPHAVAIDSQNRVLVLDRDNDRIQVFSRDGGFLESWDDFVRPMDLHIDQSGRIFVSDQAPRLAVLDSSGQLIGRCRPVMSMAHGVTGDSAGNIYLSEMTPAFQITQLTPLR